MAKGKVVGKIKRKAGNFYFVDKSGSIRETPIRRKKRKK